MTSTTAVARRIVDRIFLIIPPVRVPIAELLPIVGILEGISFRHTDDEPWTDTTAEDGPSKATIWLNLDVDEDTLTRHFFHELAELYASADHPGLWDDTDEPGFRRNYTGSECPLDFRHQIAVEAEQMASLRWGVGVDTQESANDRRLRFRATLVELWHKNHPALPDIEYIDPEIVL